MLGGDSHGVWIQWNGMVDWNGGMEYWNKRMKQNGETESPAVHVFSL